MPWRRSISSSRTLPASRPGRQFIYFSAKCDTTGSRPMPAIRSAPRCRDRGLRRRPRCADFQRSSSAGIRLGRRSRRSGDCPNTARGGRRGIGLMIDGGMAWDAEDPPRPRQAVPSFDIGWLEERCPALLICGRLRSSEGFRRCRSPPVRMAATLGLSLLWSPGIDVLQSTSPAVGLTEVMRAPLWPKRLDMEIARQPPVPMFTECCRLAAPFSPWCKSHLALFECQSN